MSEERLCEAYGEHQPYCSLRGFPIDKSVAELIADASFAARAEAFAEIRRGVEGLAFRAITGSSLDERGIHGDLSCDWDEYLDLLDRAAVLALLPSVSPEDRG